MTAKSAAELVSAAELNQLVEAKTSLLCCLYLNVGFNGPLMRNSYS